MFELLASALLIALPAQGVDVPANDGWVTDLADLLSPAEESSLESLMESYKEGSGHEIALLTIPSLEGQSLEGYSLEVARAWGIGSPDDNDGALLFVARDDRKMRIEVGRGLEGTLTDSISGRIIRDVIAPEFKRDRYPAGLRAGVEAMHAAAGGDYGPIRSSRGGEKASGAALGCFSMILNLVIMFAIFGAIRRSRRSDGKSGGGFLPWLVLASMGGGRGGGLSGGGGGGGGFGGFGGGGGFSGGGASGGW